MHRTTIMLPESLRARVARKAGEMRVSLGQFLRVAAEDYLDREERKRSEDVLLRGEYVITAPVPSNVSERVDQVLYGARRRKRS